MATRRLPIARATDQHPPPPQRRSRDGRGGRAASPSTEEQARHEQDARIAQAALTDREAFSDLYEAYVGRVYRYLLSRTSDPAEAEELTSRTFLNALTRLHQFRGGGAKFQSWLMSIAHNLLVNWYRDRGRRPPIEALDAAVAVPADIPGPEASLEENERIGRVRAAISSLPPDRQQVIALKYVDGRTNAEIGRMMGRTEGAVKALHHRTLRDLQERLADVEAETPPAKRGRGGRGRP